MATYWENSCSFGLRYVSWYKYLIVSLVFSHLGFWSGNLFLIAPFPDLCLLVPFCTWMRRSEMTRNNIFEQHCANFTPELEIRIKLRSLKSREHIQPLNLVNFVSLMTSEPPTLPKKLLFWKMKQK